MRKVSFFGFVCGFAAFIQGAMAADLPFCNDAEIVRIVAEEIQAMGKKERILSPMNVRSFELIKKYGGNMAEIDMKKLNEEKVYSIRDKIMELKVNKSLSLDDIRLCKGTYTKVKNDVYALIYPNGEYVGVYTFVSLIDDIKENEQNIKY